MKSEEKKHGRKVTLDGSERKPILRAKGIGGVDSAEKLDVTIIVRRNPSSAQRSAEELGRVPPKNRTHLSREEFARTQGASQEDLKKISEFAREYGLVVKDSSVPRRSVTLSGNAKQFSEAFGVELKKYEYPTMKGKTFRGRSGPVYIPESLSGIIQAVLGLDNRPQANPRFRQLLPEQISTVSYNPPQVAKLYDYPAELYGQGECLGIIELGGGTSQSDLNAYFQSLGLVPPRIVSISVDGGTNTPTGDPSGPDGEVMLDIEVAGSIANGATIALYFAPNTDMGFVDAVTTAINDSQNKPSVISISWGSAENTWTTQAITALNNGLEDAASMGVTTCVASGDGGSSDGETDGLAHVDFPASSPYVLGCGGTSLPSISSEVVWNDQPQDGATGGGVSDVFPVPSWQSNANVPPSANPGAHIGRGVPDVAGDADPSTGYSIQVDGSKIILGGTSAVAPLWAGLVVLINEKLGHSLGYFNPILYEDKLSSDLHDITRGNNGAYSAGTGWNACTGYGSPDGSKLLNAVFSMLQAS